MYILKLRTCFVFTFILCANIKGLLQIEVKLNKYSISKGTLIYGKISKV